MLMKKIRFLGLILSVAAIAAFLMGCRSSTDDGYDNGYLNGNGHTVTLHPNGGTVAGGNSITGVANNTTISPPSITKAWHQLLGWYREAAFITPWDFAVDTVTGNISLHARWEPVQIGNYLVTFHLHGGTHDNMALMSQQIPDGTPVGNPGAPTREGWTFDGWFDAQIGGVAWNFGNPITGTTNIHAQWTIIQHTVTFNTQGGSAVPPQNVDHGSFATRPATDPTRIDHTFQNWYTTATGGGDVHFNFTATAITAPVTIYARWSWNDPADAQDFGPGFPPNPGAFTPGPGNPRVHDGIQCNATWVTAFNEMRSDPAGTNHVFNITAPFTITSGGQNIPGGRMVSIRGAHLVEHAAGISIILEDLDSRLVLRETNFLRVAVSATAGTQFIQRSGSISGNTVGPGGVTGVGVTINNADFIMHGGAISNNNVTSTGAAGVRVIGGGSFTMHGGTISGNTNTVTGGGVSIENPGSTFTMAGGTISGNSSGNDAGAGVFVGAGNTFTMTNGAIYGNTGNGVTVGWFGPTSTFTMTGGSIHGTGTVSPNTPNSVQVHDGAATYNGIPITTTPSTIGIP